MTVKEQNNHINLILIKLFLLKFEVLSRALFLQRRATLTLIKNEVEGIVMPMLFNQSKFGVYYSVLSLFPARSTCASCKHHIPVKKKNAEDKYDSVLYNAPLESSSGASLHVRRKIFLLKVYDSQARGNLRAA